ncbi:type-F conjugative transfer system pilin assembly protein TraF [Thiotrichales bacterium 19S11-10]|nr:type-F conjugative transfer system pilin assembly protein TraF [Thiotrichales bacterium 19S11-10]
MKFILIFLSICLSSNLFAAYQSHGWHWYSSDYIDYSDDEKSIVIKPQVEEKPISYSQQLEEFRRYYKEVQDKAVITKDVNDVAYAAKLRAWMMKNSIEYGQSFKEALLKYPELSANISNPTAQVARQVAFSEKTKSQDRAIRKLSKEFGLFFFYRGNNPYAQAMAKSVQEFADLYDIELIGFPVDGYVLSDIKNNKPYTNQMQALGVKALPALFLANPKERKSMPLAYGFVAQDTIKEHFLDLATHFGKEGI